MNEFFKISELYKTCKGGLKIIHACKIFNNQTITLMTVLVLVMLKIPDSMDINLS